MSLKSKKIINTLHRQSPASGLFLQAVSARLENMQNIEFLRCILECVADIHKVHSGRVIQLLVTKFLNHPILALSRKADDLACTRVETLLCDKPFFNISKGKFSFHSGANFALSQYITQQTR